MGLQPYRDVGGATGDYGDVVALVLVKKVSSLHLRLTISNGFVGGFVGGCFPRPGSFELVDG